MHDSGGIAGGDDAEVHAITNFLQSRSNAKYLKDQVHCIWCVTSKLPLPSSVGLLTFTIRYCLSLQHDRPLDKFDRKFLGNLSKNVGPVPVIIIFTKFDSLVARHREILSRQRPRLPDIRLDETAEAKASQEFETRYLKAMQEATKSYPKRVPYVRVGRMQHHERGGAERGQ